MIMVTSLND